MQRGLLLALCLSAGCAGLDGRTEDQLSNARKSVDTDPNVTLSIVEPVLVQQPDNLEALWLRAEALSALGRAEPACEAWKSILARDLGLDDEQEIDAHLHFAVESLHALGPLPHSVTTPLGAEVRARAAEAMQSCEFVLARRPGTDEAVHAKAICLYLLCRHEEALAALDLLSSVAESASQPAQFLRALLLEHPSGFDPHALDLLRSLVHGGAAGIFVPAATHLIHLADSGKLTDEQRVGVQSELLRLGRREDSPAEVSAWLRRYEAAESQRLPQILAKRQFEDVDTAQRTKTWARGWAILEGMPADVPEVAGRRRSFVKAWAEELFESARQRLAASDMEGVRQILAGVQSLPVVELSPELQKEHKRIAERLQNVEVTARARQRFAEAETALKRKRPHDAIDALKGLEQEITAELRPQLFLLRARALLSWGDRKGALAAYDECRALLEITDKRQYAVLLAEAGRAEEATDYLELLPLGALQGDTFTALLSALERQGRWESILSRLGDLEPVPEAYKPLLARAAVEAAQRRVRLGDPTRALEILRGSLSPAELRKAPAFAVHLRALLDARDFEAATTLLLAADRATFLSLSQGQVLQALDALADRISDQKRFEMLTILRAETDDQELERDIVKLLPRFANYLPEPGNYSASYRYQVFSSEGGMESGAKTMLADLVWENDHFVVTGEGWPREEWWIEEGVWHRLGEDGDLLIPIRVGADGALPVQTFERGAQEWTAAIVEAGIRFEVGAKSYEGCLRIRLGAVGAKNDYYEVVLAPQLGEIQRTNFSNGRKNFTQELLELVRKP